MIRLDFKSLSSTVSHDKQIFVFLLSSGPEQVLLRLGRGLGAARHQILPGTGEKGKDETSPPRPLKPGR